MGRGHGVALVGLLLAASTLTSCSLTRQPPSATGTTGATASPTGTSSVTVSSPGGTSTPAATRLRFGQSIARDWSPRQGVTGRISLRVTAIEQAEWTAFQGWQVSRATRRATRPYFIRATVANVGTADLGGYPVPLYALDNREELVEASTFGSTSGNLSFGPCHPDRLPASFKHGATLRGCLVMLVPRRSAMVGASFRPEQTAEPVTWSGRIQRPTAKHHA